MDIQIIFEQIGILSILVIIGIIATKANIINESNKKAIVDLIFNITLPLLIFTTLANIDLTPEILYNSALVFIFSFVSLVLFYYGGIASSKILKLKGNSVPVHILHTLFGNIVLLGFPLINALFPGGDGILYATIFQLASVSLLWTLGINTLSKKKHIHWKENLLNLLNPNTISFFIGFAFMLLPVKLPGILNKPLSGLGESTFYLSMLYIGAMMTAINVKGIFRDWSAFVLSFNKLLLLPVLLIFVMSFTIQLMNITMSFTAIAVVVLESAMPCQVIITILSRKYGQNDLLATKNLFVSSVLCVLTLPVVFWVLKLAFG